MPCDGRILHFGKVNRGYVEQVKGVDYLLEAFLGPQTWSKTTLKSHISSATTTNNAEYHAQYERSILSNPLDNCLYHCVIYLAPGDYHRFHSPADWQVSFRRHFPGELFSVNPAVARWLQGLFSLNERAVYYGQWKYGFFSMTAVGATNVGSIKVYMDGDLTTNNKKSTLVEKDLEKDFSTSDKEARHVSRGELFGEFNLGSTIVLIFEAPKNFQFNVHQNEKVFYGNHLGSAAAVAAATTCSEKQRDNSNL
jgi:phosphatidylserine decarboxylase